MRRPPFLRVASVWEGADIRWWHVIHSCVRWGLGLGMFLPLTLIWYGLTFFRSPEWLDPYSKWIGRATLRVMGIRVRFVGAPPDDGTVRIFAANHVMLFDPFLYYGFLPGLVRGVELEDHFSWFFYGRLIRRLGTIPISQKNARASLESLSRAQKALHEGTSIIILPEGQRTLTGDFMPFRNGAFRLAEQSGMPMVPVYMHGAWSCARRGSLLIRPGIVTLYFGAPILSGTSAPSESGSLRERYALAMGNLRALAHAESPH